MRQEKSATKKCSFFLYFFLQKAPQKIVIFFTKTLKRFRQEKYRNYFNKIGRKKRPPFQKFTKNTANSVFLTVKNCWKYIFKKYRSSFNKIRGKSPSFQKFTKNSFESPKTKFVFLAVKKCSKEKSPKKYKKIFLPFKKKRHKKIADLRQKKIIRKFSQFSTKPKK